MTFAPTIWNDVWPDARPPYRETWFPSNRDIFAVIKQYFEKSQKAGHTNDEWLQEIMSLIWEAFDVM